MKRLEPPFTHAHGAPRVSCHGEGGDVVAAISASGQYVFSSVGDLGAVAVQELDLDTGVIEVGQGSDLSLTSLTRINMSF